MQLYDKGMCALLSFLSVFLKSLFQDLKFKKLMNTYPKCRNWSGLVACS